MSDNPIFVTRPYLPPIEEFLPYLQKIWQDRVLTNNGPFHQQLERDLCEYLGVEHISLFANGTLALLIALKVLKVSGEVITTPFSFPATTHALDWLGIRPNFVDIDPKNFNIDADKIEASITDQTSAILPVHVYGQPCNVKRLKEIAENFNLKVIYDAAHAFGVKLNDTSLLNCGDLSILSFHATKVFNTFEGGAIVCSDPKIKQEIDCLKNFGIVDDTTVISSGINAKLSEVQAALGLVQLQHMEKVIDSRAKIDAAYRQKLEGINGIHCIECAREIVQNYAYFPIIVEPSYPLSRDQLYQHLKDFGVHARRYFYPLISEMPMYAKIISANPDNLPIAKKVADQVLCLPIFPDLRHDQVMKICDLIINLDDI